MVSLWSWLLIPLRLIMLRIFWCVYWPFVYLLCRHFSSSTLCVLNWVICLTIDIRTLIYDIHSPLLDIWFTNIFSISRLLIHFIFWYPMKYNCCVLCSTYYGYINWAFFFYYHYDYYISRVSPKGIYFVCIINKKVVGQLNDKIL